MRRGARESVAFARRTSGELRPRRRAVDRAAVVIMPEIWYTTLCKEERSLRYVHNGNTQGGLQEKACTNRPRQNAGRVARFYPQTMCHARWCKSLSGVCWPPALSQRETDRYPDVSHDASTHRIRSLAYPDICKKSVGNSFPIPRRIGFLSLPHFSERQGPDIRPALHRIAEAQRSVYNPSRGSVGIVPYIFFGRKGVSRQNWTFADILLSSPVLCGQKMRTLCGTILAAAVVGARAKP